MKIIFKFSQYFIIIYFVLIDFTKMTSIFIWSTKLSTKIFLLIHLNIYQHLTNTMWTLSWNYNFTMSTLYCNTICWILYSLVNSKKQQRQLILS